MNAHSNEERDGRRVVANLALSLNGSCHGAGGPDDFALIAPYAVTDVAGDHMARFISSATTASARRSRRGSR